MDNHVSYSMISTYKSCPYKYKLHYIDEIESLPNYETEYPIGIDGAVLGTAVHRAIETNIETAIKEYFDYYPVITEDIMTKSIIIEHQIKEVLKILPEPKAFEVEINNNGFLGYIDMIDKNDNLYDFKFSNNVEMYKESPQIHIYKFFAQKQGMKINNINYLIIPKPKMFKKTQNMSIFQYREELLKDIPEPFILPIEYSEDKVNQFLKDVIACNSHKGPYNKIDSRLCDYCEYNKLCKENVDYDIISKGVNMLLPSTERRDISKVSKRKLWIYGAPFSGKTTFLDESPNPLNLNTDGNISQVTMPVISIKDEVKFEGRIEQRTFAWQKFKEIILELEKKQNNFSTIIIDLVDDLREYCRIYEYNKLKIQHESDAGYGKGYDMVKTEFLSVMKRFFNLDYENLVIVSHENSTSGITKKDGGQVTKIIPNIQEALAYKLAGMVDIVARVVINDDGTRSLNFNQDEVIFGGGRLRGIKTNSIPLKWSEFTKLYDGLLVSNNKVSEDRNTPSIPINDKNVKAVETKKEIINRQEVK